VAVLCRRVAQRRREAALIRARLVARGAALDRDPAATLTSRLPRPVRPAPPASRGI
jgi:hypothetical protein